MLTTATKPLSIALLGMNDRAKARMELFLDHYWSSDCILVGDRFADLCILDLDSLNGKQILQQQRENHPNRPLILLSIHDTDSDGATILRKPLKGDLLKQTIEDHKAVLAKQSSQAETHAPSPTSIPQASKSNRKLSYTSKQQAKTNDRRCALPNLTTQARIIRGSCSVNESTELQSREMSSGLYYDPSTVFQHILKSHIDQCRRDERSLRLILSDEKFILLQPESNLALTNLSDNMLRSRCLLPIAQHQILVDYPDESVIDRLHSEARTPQDIDYLLWKVTLMSSRGRLPLGTNIDSVIELKQWPNMTRLLAIPQFLRIAALWTKSPSPLNKTVEALNIEAHYVRAFFSACFALELIHVLSTSDDHEITHNTPKHDVARQGLLGRILRRLRVA